MQILGGLSQVSVDGTTITGNGTPASPLVGNSGTPAGWPLTWWGSPGFGTATNRALVSSANTLSIWGVALPAATQLNKIFISVHTADASGLYDIGFYTGAGALAAHIGAQHIPSTGLQSYSVVGGPITLAPGRYYFAVTGNATVAAYDYWSYPAGTWSFIFSASFGTSTGGALPSTITPPADSVSQIVAPIFALSI
jgi:hypothetical protein